MSVEMLTDSDVERLLAFARLHYRVTFLDRALTRSTNEVTKRRREVAAAKRAAMLEQFHADALVLNAQYDAVMGRFENAVRAHEAAVGRSDA